MGVFLYGALFIIVLPAALIAWAAASGSNIALPAIRSVPFGFLFSLTGAFLAGWGVLSLLVHGDGLPMNPFPPAQYVTQGAYRILPHPIYTGFGMLSVGVSLLFGSQSGLWVVSPLVILGSAALVAGYERIDLRQRFGVSLPMPYFRIPPAGEEAPSVRDRLSVYVLVLLPWGVLYELTALMGIPAGAINSFFDFEYRIPVMEWTEPLYFGTYVFVLLAPALAPTGRTLRAFALRGLAGTLLMVLLFTCIPLIAPPRPFSPGGFWGGLLMLERTLDTPANSFPSYHVFWILLAASVYAARMPRLRFAWWVVGSAVALSCITTGMHSVVDVAGGVLLFVATANLAGLWESIRKRAERIANSWKEWSVGPLRVINHGVFAGIGSMIAVLIVGILVGPAYVLPFIFVAVTALVVAALWAQFVEGSPSLLRPYGYYGGVLGVISGSVLTLPLFGTDPWLLLAAYSVAGPWVQSFGRLRCLVQGCCHGSPAPPHIGIVYRHPRSRVTRLSNLGGVPVHPTPVYSILWNVVIAFLLTRLWFTGAPLSLIGGLYLILTGIGRFVEEAYRGEPQTRVIAGLRFYQWIAIVTVVSGAVVTCIASDPAPALLLFDWRTVAVGFLFGVVAWFSLGVDFPGSNRRFARLV